MRRNTIISDIFSRLHYMERRGSGLSRIIESYNDVDEKPKFISDSLSFTVIFPNKSYNSENENRNNKNIVTDEELFLIKLYKNLPSMNIKSSTINQIKLIFDNVGFYELFSRDDIKNILQVKDTRATNIISLLLDLELIAKKEGTKYKFKK